MDFTRHGLAAWISAAGDFLGLIMPTDTTPAPIHRCSFASMGLVNWYYVSGCKAAYDLLGVDNRFVCNVSCNQRMKTYPTSAEFVQICFGKPGSLRRNWLGVARLHMRFRHPLHGYKQAYGTRNAVTHCEQAVIAQDDCAIGTQRLGNTFASCQALYLHFLIVKNDDSPGMVGIMGTALGNAKANIANLSLARNSSEGSALTVIELDEPLDSAVMEEIRCTAGVIYATGVTL